MNCLLSLLRILIAVTASPASQWSRPLLSSHILYALIRLLVTAKRGTSGSLPALQGPTPPSSDSGDDLTFDIICLTLGLLAHILEASPTAADRLRETLIDPQCLAPRECTKRCSCPAARSAIHVICALYLEKTAVKLANEDENAVFLRSYLTMLLALLALSSEASRTMILANLAGHEAAKRWLREAVEESIKVQEEAGSTAQREEAKTLIGLLRA